MAVLVPRAAAGGGKPFSPARQRARAIVRSYTNIFLHTISAAQLAVFLISLYLEDWKLEELQRNPLVGPSLSGILKIGGTSTSDIRERNQWWRLAASPFVSAGAIHLWSNITCFWVLGVFLASKLTTLQIVVLYVLSGAAGVLASANIATSHGTAAASGPAFGFLGATFTLLAFHWRYFKNYAVTAVILTVFTLLNLFIGATPFVDQSCNLAGFAAGVLVTLGYLLVQVQDFGSRTREIVLQAAAAISIGLVVAAIFAGILGLCMSLPAANCCDQLVCTPLLGLWDCEASRISSTQCTFTAYKTNTTVVMSCPQGTVYNFDNLASSEMEQMCSLLCNAVSIKA